MSAILCSVCQKNIPKSVYKIKCGICTRYSHLPCAGVSEVDAKVLHQQKKTWNCSACRDAGNQPESNLNKTKNHHATRQRGDEEEGRDLVQLSLLVNEIKDLKTEISEMKTSLQYISDLFETERVRNKVLSEIVDDLKKENTSLRRELGFVTSYVNNIEHQKIKNNLVITGICNDEKELKEYTERKTIAVLRRLDGNIKKENIKAIRVKKTKANKHLVVVTLESEQKRDSIVKSRKNVGQLTGELCNIKDAGRIYINEELTSMSFNLLREANKLKNIGYKFIWARNGSIYARLKEGDPAKKIFNIYHVQEIMAES